MPLLAGSMTYLYLGIAILSEVAATTFLKLSDGFSKPLPSLVTVAGYGIAFYFLSLTLRSMPVGVAYAIWSGVGIVLISLAGWLLYKQLLDLPALLGMGLIMAGVVVINLFSKTAVH
jgi:small multidrug resistance pump